MISRNKEQGDLLLDGWQTNHFWYRCHVGSALGGVCEDHFSVTPKHTRYGSFVSLRIQHFDGLTFQL